MQHSSVLSLVFFTSVICVVRAQTLNLGSCPTVTVKKDFNLTQYAGTWYEYTKNRRYFTIMDSGYRCVTETYTFTGNDTISIVNKGNRVLGGRPYLAEGTGKMVSPGKFEFTFDDLTFSPRDVPYWVLDTDYENYSVVWSCSQRGGMNAQITWILTRDPLPDATIVRKALDVLSVNRLARGSLMKTIQENCVYSKLRSKKP